MEAVRQSEQHLEMISNTVPALISYVDREFCYRTCNEAYLKWFGVSRDAVIGKPVREILGEEAWSAVRPHIEAGFAGETVDYEIEVNYLRAGRRWIHAVYTPHRNALGEVIGLVVMVTDITARKRAEETFREGDERFRAVANQVTVGVTRTDLAGRFTFANPRYCEIVGYTPTELLEMRMQDMAHAEDLSGYLDQFYQLVDGGADFVIEQRYLRKDGCVIWVNNSVSSVRDAHGQLKGALVVTLDITQRRRQELELAHRSRQQALMYELAEVVNRADALDDLYQKALDVITASLSVHRCSILLFDPDGVMRFKAWRNLSDPYRRAVEGHSPWPREEHHARPIHVRDVAEAALDVTLADVIRREGIRALSFIPLTYGGRLIGKFMVYFDQPQVMSDEDVSLAQAIAGTLAIGIERKTTEAQLREHQEQLQAFADHMEQLVDERTQELVQSRDQLRALATELNLAEQRERKRVAAELHDYLAQLLVLAKMKLGQGKRLADRIPACVEFIRESEDALTEALTYTRTLVADLSPPVLHDFGLPTALGWLGQQMERHQLKVAVRVAPDVHPKLPTDRALLVFQSVRELLMNIAKHSGTGEACLSVAQSSGYLRIEVRDEGKGFTVAPESGASSKFGLFSIRERMRALGGTFDIDSAPGKGTTALLTLPVDEGRMTECQPVEAEADVAREASANPSRRFNPPVFRGQPAGSSQHSVKPIRVLLVDDHAMVRQGLRSVLDGYADIEVIGEASNGEEAVAMTERLRPSLVLMDINMPKMSGVDATAHIKTRHPEIVVIGLSVQAGHEPHLAMLKAGATRLLTKEAAVDQLHHAILHALNRVAEAWR
jgi:PAS domain S-box-containing protein